MKGICVSREKATGFFDTVFLRKARFFNEGNFGDGADKGDGDRYRLRMKRESKNIEMWATYFKLSVAK